MIGSLNMSTNGVSDGAAGTTGHWVDTSNLEAPYTIFIAAAGVGDTYQIMVANGPTAPADATDGNAYGSVLNAANSVAKITENYNFVKAKKTAGTQTSIPYLFGVAHK